MVVRRRDGSEHDPLVVNVVYVVGLAMGRYLELARKVAQKAPAIRYDKNDINDKSPAFSPTPGPQPSRTAPAVPERRDYECRLIEWLNQNPATSDPGRCAWCGEPEGTGNGMLLPLGTETAGHTWLHSRCWSAWHARRHADATEALALLGITPPDSPEQQ